MPWKATAQSEIGVSHQQLGLPCQDYCGFQIIDDVIIGVVADGAGSSCAADVGAQLTVQSCLETAQHFTTWWQDPKHQRYRDGSQILPLRLARFGFQHLIAQVTEALEKEALHSGYQLPDLACTLLVFVATPHWVAAMQIGDGLMVVQQPDGEYQLVFQPQKGEFANQTRFVTSAQVLATMEVRVLEGTIQFISAMTDGLESVAIEYRNWLPFAPFFAPLHQFMTETPCQQVLESDYLGLFLKSDRLNRKTSDDKSLILALYESDNPDQ